MLRSVRAAIASASLLMTAGAGLALAPAASAAPVSTDLGLAPVSAADQVPRGTQTDLAFSITGGDATTAATLTLTLPTGVTLTGVTVDGSTTPVTCTASGSTQTCLLGPVPGSPTVNVGLDVAATVAIGTAESVRADVEPVGTDPDPSNNVAEVQFAVVGNAAVTQTSDPAQVDVPLGGSAPFTVTLHNDGPDPATGVRTRFTIQSNDAPPPTITGFSSPAVTALNGGYVWDAGTIPVGGTVSVTATVSASSPAVDSAITYSTSYDGVVEICGTSASCDFGAPVRTTAAVTAPVSTPPTTASTRAAAPTLAATGSDDGPALALGLGLLVAGAALTTAARGRRV